MRTSVIAAAVFMAVLMAFSDVLGADDLGARLDRLAMEVAHQAEIIQAQQKTIWGYWSARAGFWCRSSWTFLRRQPS
jgi:hypothetical protein